MFPDCASLHPGYAVELAPHPTGWNESARAMAQASRKRGSWVPSINSPGRSAYPAAANVSAGAIAAANDDCIASTRCA
jgi:hypothetical protein